MRILLQTAFSEQTALIFLNALATVNAGIHRNQALPLLYDSGVVYEREEGEIWCDVINMYRRRHEDCDALAAARVGEVKALGWKAFKAGDPGFDLARKLKPTRIPARCALTTTVPKGSTGLYHCIAQYKLGGRWIKDDPSKRLGMNGPFDDYVLRRWRVAGLQLPLDTYRA